MTPSMDMSIPHVGYTKCSNVHYVFAITLNKKFILTDRIARDVLLHLIVALLRQHCVSNAGLMSRNSPRYCKVCK
jgi:hypothetical protein